MSKINIYCDEVIRPNKKEYLILGALFIEESDLSLVAREIEKGRALNPLCQKWHYDYSVCPSGTCKENLHSRNNTTIHFNELRDNKERKKIALAWLDFIKRDAGKKVKFYLLVIDLAKLDCSRFGENKTDLNIYTRFFRTLVKGGVKYFFNGKNNRINCIYHDEGSQEKHDYFPHLNLKKIILESQESWGLEEQKISFVNSDHRPYLKKQEYEFVTHSQFIQLTDIILGSFSQLFLNLSGMSDKREVAESLRKLFTEVMFKEDYYPASVSFFPKYSLKEIEGLGQSGLDGQKLEGLQRALSLPENFYNFAKFTMPPFLGNQRKIGEWFDRQIK